ncbi:MAG: O-methyltransferase [Candidatus Kariarchaeaceae archaeon]|jgi:predicted O-methyltransferase YrrM
MTPQKDLLKLITNMEAEDVEQRERGLSSERRWRSLARSSAELLSLFVRLVRAKIIVEIGTSQGFSTIWLGLGAKSVGGKVISFEISDWRHQKAIENIGEAELSDIVELILGDPLLNLDKLPDNIDILFLDAEKVDYLEQVTVLFPKVISGGIIVADNVASHEKELQDYLTFVRNHNECNSILIPIGRGLEITYKIPKNEIVLVPWKKLI